MQTEDSIKTPEGKDGLESQSRRSFLKMMMVFAVGAAAIGTMRGGIQSLARLPPQALSTFPTLTLVNGSGAPIKTSDIPVNSALGVLFPYPLTNEPNFLLRLGDKNGNDVAVTPQKVSIPDTGGSFLSPGGVGPYKSVVAASAICQHAGCLFPQLRFYPPTSSSYPGLIQCGCHGSQYDPYKGFGVVSTPTRSPLPNVTLSYDATTDTYQAVGMIGPVIFNHTNDLSGGTAAKSSTSTVTEQSA
ncbi:MAG: Rieske 2Fe-2S domain-containing protein [Thermoplasmataceae archaeon]